MTKEQKPDSRPGGTETRSFGAGERRSHDSTTYYARRINQAQPMAREKVHYHENPLPAELTNQALEEPFTRTEHEKSSRDSLETPPLPDQSVHLLTTSIAPHIPPTGLEGWLELLLQTWQEALRVLTPAGRMCLTVVNPEPYVPLHGLITGQCQDLGLLMRGEIILQLEGEAKSVGHRYMLVWSKDGYRRPKTMGRSSTISGSEFIKATRSIWKVANMIEAHQRAIDLYTYGGEVVCDPFTGKGDAAQAARAAGRKFVGYASDPQVQELLGAPAES